MPAAIWRPKEVTFSKKTSNESRTIQSMFVTANNSAIKRPAAAYAIRAMAKPKQKATRHVPAKATMTHQEHQRHLALGKAYVLEAGPLVAARRHEHEPRTELALGGEQHGRELRLVAELRQEHGQKNSQQILHG